MQFGILDEVRLREEADGEIDKLLDLWHEAVATRTDKKIEVRLGNRRDNTSPIRGGVLTESVITMNAGRTVLMIWYDPMEIYYDSRIEELGYSKAVIDEMTEMLKEDLDPGAEFDPVANPQKIEWDNVVRQIARWTLRFRGYNKLHNENKNFFELEAFLNLECAIPVMYSLLEEAGWDRSAGASKRLSEVYEGLSGMEEPPRRLDRALNALRISNILEYNEESELKGRLAELLAERFKRTQEDRARIDLIRADYDLGQPAGYLEYIKKLVLTFRMPGNWTALDETAGII
ncbi:MAG: hypothetical protein JEZ04_13140 [Spirochaetales bacterium]|nr:hypothetical protein [Spirochaetales bacterium]